MRQNPKYLAILAVVSKIPKGCVATYGEVAAISGCPRCARLVGTVLRSRSGSDDIPWHRVVNAKGNISFPKDSANYHLQKQRLRDEGVSFQSDGINLKRYGWQHDLDEILWS